MRWRFALGVGIVTAIFAAGCSSRKSGEQEPTGKTAKAATVGGCQCATTGGCSSVSYSDIPADGVYYITTFGGGADTQGMACGGTADGTWAYVADEARFGCGAKLLIEANGKACIGEVADCGPNRCVEEAACSCSCGGHFPILDASPLITQYLFGISGSGWSDKTKVTVSLVDGSLPSGCPAPPVDVDSGAAGSGGVAGSAGSGGTGASSGGSGGSGGSGAAGGSPSGGGAAGGGGSGGQAAGSPPPSDESGGCSCRAAGSRRTSGPLALFALLGAVSLRRRRALLSRRDDDVAPSA